MKKLPENWCVKNDGSLLFQNTVIAEIKKPKQSSYSSLDIDNGDPTKIGGYYGVGMYIAFGLDYEPPHFTILSLAEFIEITESKEALVLIMANELLDAKSQFTGRELKIALYEKLGLRLSGMELRSILHGLRCSGKLPLLVANTTGYWIATTTYEVEKYREFLQERAKKFFELSACIRDQAESKFGNQLSLEIK